MTILNLSAIPTVCSVMNHRKLFKKTDILIVAACLLLAGVLCLPRLLGGREHLTAVITADNEVYTEIDLDEAGEQTITVNHTTITVRDGTVFFSESDCPDGVCMKTGALDCAGDSAACVPNRVAITIRGEKPDVDAVAY